VVAPVVAPLIPPPLPPPPPSAAAQAAAVQAAAAQSAAAQAAALVVPPQHVPPLPPPPAVPPPPPPQLNNTAAMIAAAAAAAAAVAVAASAAAAEAEAVSYQATTAATSHVGVPTVQAAADAVTTASAAAAAAATAANTASKNAAAATNPVDAQREQKEAERLKTLAESKRDEANNAMADVTAAVAAAVAAAAAAAAASAASAAKAAIDNYKTLLTEAVNAFQDIITPLPQVPDFETDQSTKLPKLQETAAAVLTPLLQEIQTKIQDYDTKTREYKESNIGATKPLDEVELNKLKDAADKCNPLIDVSNVRNLFDETKGMFDELKYDMNTTLAPLIEGIKRNILSIDNKNSDNTQNFTELKQKCEELANGYKKITETTTYMIPNINLKITEYSDLFETTKATVLAGIQQRLTAIVGTLSQPPTDPDGERLINEIDRLLASVD
jgi:hypothetical protein